MTRRMARNVLITIGMLVNLSIAVGLSSDEQQAVDKIYLKRSIKFTGGIYKEHSFPYRLLVPSNYKPGTKKSDKKWPLILFLHGAGERGDNNLAQLKYFPTDMASLEMRKEYQVFLLAPQCPKNRAWSAPTLRDVWKGFRPEPVEEARVVMHILDRILEEFPVDRGRVYLTGLSMGGFGSWDLAARYPKRWAAVVPICGGGDPKTVTRFKDLPIWVFHGSKDTVVPPTLSKAMVKALRNVGGTVKFTEFPDAGHNSWTPGYRHPDFLPWLFAQRRKVSAKETKATEVRSTTGGK